MNDTMRQEGQDLIPLIRERSGKIDYGGSQEWYEDPWAEMAGCAATCASNLAAYYEIGITPLEREEQQKIYSQESFLQLMNIMFRGYMTPGNMGFPHRYKFQEKFLDYAERRGVHLTTRFCEGWKDRKEASAFVKQNIDAGSPLALLVLTHRSPEMMEDTWHWMTITGYAPETGDILLSNYGEKVSYHEDILFEPHPVNVVKMISFEKI